MMYVNGDGGGGGQFCDGGFLGDGGGDSDGGGGEGGGGDGFGGGGLWVHGVWQQGEHLISVLGVAGTVVSSSVLELEPKVLIGATIAAITTNMVNSNR